MSDNLIPDEIAKRTARLINEAENVRAQAVDDLKTIYADLREELKSLGWRGAEVSEQVAAFKAAISEMRLDDEKKAKREAKGDLVSEYINVLTVSRARARVWAKESVQSHEALVLSATAGSASDDMPATNQPVTANEMVGGFPVPAAPFSRGGTGGCNPENIAGDGRDVEAADGAASVATNSNPQASSSRQADKAETAPPVVSAAFTNPKCLKPKTCPNAHSKTACFDCVMEYGKRPAEEQKRLWAEAMGVAA